MTTFADEVQAAPDVDARLRDVARLVRRAMLDAIPDGEPHPWLYGPAREYPSRPGKALRPALCLATAKAFGGRGGDVVGGAGAHELLHNAVHVHHAGGGGGEQRRGRPTQGVQLGVARARNARGPHAGV
jgi:geranylgeranyl diphosphate synthase type II